jgi:hypothetical protein
MKTNLDGIFKSDENLARDGVWFDLSDTVGFKLRQYNQFNPNTKAAVARHLKPYAHQIDKNILDPKKGLEIKARLLVEISLVDWKGIEIDGKPTDFSPEIAVQFLMELPDLLDTLTDHAQRTENYRKDTEALGNSSQITSDGA